jgi:hypothetical protein
MPGEQEDQRFVSYLLDVHRLAGVRIASAQQPREEIGAVGSRLLPVRDQLVDHRVDRAPGACRSAVVRSRPGRRRRQRRHRAPERVLLRIGKAQSSTSPASLAMSSAYAEICLRVNSGWTSRRCRCQSSPSLVSNPPAEGLRDLLVEPVALRIPLARTGEHGPDAVGMEHAVQVEADAGRSDRQTHDVSVLAHHALVRADLASAQVGREPEHRVCTRTGWRCRGHGSMFWLSRKRLPGS